MKLLCKIFHRWANIDDSKNGHSNQKCRRCGVQRDYYGTGGWGCYGEPYTPETEVSCHHQYVATGLGTGRCVHCDAIKHYQPERTAKIANEMVEEIWKLRNEIAASDGQMAAEAIRMYRSRCIQHYEKVCATDFQKGVIIGLDCALSFLPNAKHIHPEPKPNDYE